tara:strand:+ start:83 stop:340 length:258 start_codon:yes stop_codon:yes gene_type:complete
MADKSKKNIYRKTMGFTHKGTRGHFENIGLAYQARGNEILGIFSKEQKAKGKARTLGVLSEQTKYGVANKGRDKLFAVRRLVKGT